MIKDNVGYMNEYKYDEDFFIFYFVPTFMSIGIFIIFDGRYDSHALNLTYTGVGAIGVGLVIIIFCLISFYTIIVKIPKTIGGWKLVKSVIVILLRSKFFYFFFIYTIYC